MWMQLPIEDANREIYVRSGELAEDKYQKDELRDLMRRMTVPPNLQMPMYADWDETYRWTG